MLEVVYYWVQGTQEDYAKFECGIGSDNTMVDFYMYCRQACYEYLERNFEMLGGPGIIVEVDEAKFGRRKFHRGSRVDGVWIFGMVERGSRMTRCSMMPVECRDEETLIGQIKKFVAPGTTIYSDCWAGYNGLAAADYTHKKVNHSKQFKVPNTDVHTNNIEGLWNQVRRSFPKFGTTKDHYASHLTEFIYKRRYFSDIHRNERFYTFLRHLSSLSNLW